ATGDRGPMHQTAGTEDILKKAFYPLTLPLTVGQGSISIAITLGANQSRHLGPKLIAVFTAAVAALLIAFSACLGSRCRGTLAAAVGRSGMNVILRLSAFFLVCIGVQTLWNGVKGLVKTL